jgi:hypothetical protein
LGELSKHHGYKENFQLSSEFRVQGSGFRVQGSGFRVQGSGFRVQGSGFRGRLCERIDSEIDRLID